MLGQRRERGPKIIPALDRRLVFAGLCLVDFVTYVIEMHMSGARGYLHWL